MSTLHANTANRIGVRRQYKPVIAMGRYAGPSETPARQGEFRTHPMPGLGIIPAGTSLPHVLSVPLQSGANPGTQINPGSFDVGPIYRVEPIYFWNQSGRATASPGSPTTSTPIAVTPGAPGVAPAPQSYTDKYGNVWEQSASGWVMVSPGPSTQQSPTPQTAALPSTAANTQPALISGAASTAQAGTPVPVGWPTNQAYTDSQGYIWTYTASNGWQVTGIAAGTAAATPAGAASVPAASAAGTTVSVSSGFDLATLTAWLQESTIISPVPNFFVVAGAGLAALLLLRPGKK